MLLGLSGPGCRQERQHLIRLLSATACQDVASKSSNRIESAALCYDMDSQAPSALCRRLLSTTRRAPALATRAGWRPRWPSGAPTALLYPCRALQTCSRSSWWRPSSCFRSSASACGAWTTTGARCLAGAAQHTCCPPWHFRASASAFIARMTHGCCDVCLQISETAFTAPW